MELVEERPSILITSISALDGSRGPSTRWVRAAILVVALVPRCQHSVSPLLTEGAGAIISHKTKRTEGGLALYLPYGVGTATFK